MSKPISYADVFDHKAFKVAHVWALYSTSIHNEATSRVQYEETKKAFYAGFLDCFKVMSDYGERLSEDDACQLFTRLQIENEEFFEAMVKAHGPVDAPTSLMCDHFFVATELEDGTFTSRCSRCGMIPPTGPVRGKL